MANAVVTLVTSSDFVIGGSVMISSFYKTHNKSECEKKNVITICMVTDNINTKEKIQLIQSGFDVILTVNAIPNPCSKKSVHVSSWFDVGFTKLRIWELKQIILENNKSIILNNNEKNTKQLNLEMIEINKIFYIDADCVIINPILTIFEKTVNFAASPDVFPPDHFNAGVLFIQPNIPLFYDIISHIAFYQSCFVFLTFFFVCLFFF